MTKQRTGYPVIDEILESIAPVSAEEHPTPWRVCRFPHSGSDVPWSIKDADGVVIMDCHTSDLAEQIVREHNAHRKLVTALERVETKSRNQTRSKSDAVDTLLEIGDIARAALALAEVQR